MPFLTTRGGKLILLGGKAILLGSTAVSGGTGGDTGVVIGVPGAGGSGGSTTPTPTGSMSQAFTLTNWGGATTLVNHKGGVWFKKGDVPAGSSPATAGVSAQFYGVTRWKDGSMRSARRLLRDVSLAPAAARSYTTTAVTGPLPVGSTAAIGNSGLVNALSGHDFKAVFSNITDSNNAVYAGGALTASLAAHATVSTRWTVLTTGPVADVWQGWGMAGSDAHLKVNWYVTRWKNADGSTLAFQIGAVVTLDWWSITGKTALTYNAVLMDGATTIVSYTGVQHPYHSQWLMCVNDGTNNVGQAPWIGAPQPTLHCTFDKAYLVSTGLVAPYNLTATPTAKPVPTYVPCESMEHRANINGTGDYMGRGIMPDSDADAFMRGDVTAYTRARVNALAGLSVPYHYRSNRQRTRPGEAADTANTSIALIMLPKPASYYDFTASGMPIAVDAYVDSRSPSSAQDGLVYPTGGTGVWTISGDCSHQPSTCFYMGLISGDEWLIEAQIDLAINLAQQQVYGYLNNRELILTGSPQKAAALAPSANTSKWTGLCGQYMEDNARALGWAQLILGHAFALIPSDHIVAGYFAALHAHNGDYIDGSLNNMPPDYELAGAYYPENQVNPRGIVAGWQNGIICSCAYANFLITEDARWQRLADHTFNWPGRIVAAGLFYALDTYRSNDRIKSGAAGDWSLTNKMVPAEQQPAAFTTITVDPTSGIFTVSPIYWNASNGTPPPFTTGDMIVFDDTALSGTSLGQVAYIRDLTNPSATSGNVYSTPQPPFTTFRLSATPGGAPLTWTSAGAATVSWLPQSIANYPVAANYPYLPGWDGYIPIHAACIMLARQAGNPAATAAMRDAMVAFLAPARPATKSSYDMVAT